MLFFTLPHKVTSCSLKNSQLAVEEIDIFLLSCRLSMRKEKIKNERTGEKIYSFMVMMTEYCLMEPKLLGKSSHLKILHVHSLFFRCLT